MGIDYYGVLAEDDERVYVVYVGRSLDVDDYRIAEIAKRLNHLYEYVNEEGWRVDEAEVATSPDVMEVLLHTFKHVQWLFDERPRLVAYVWLADLMGVEPRIISEYDLDMIKKEIVFLDLVGRRGGGND